MNSMNEFCDVRSICLYLHNYVIALRKTYVIYYHIASACLLRHSSISTTFF